MSGELLSHLIVVNHIVGIPESLESHREVCDREEDPFRSLIDDRIHKIEQRRLFGRYVTRALLWGDDGCDGFDGTCDLLE